VILLGRNSQSAALTPIRYEFSGATSGEDSDWVVIDGQVATDQGHWKFQDVALLAGECPDLTRWLLRAAYSEVSPTEPSDDPTLTFLESSLALNVASYGDN
jgi:hypothetical protein